MLDAVEKTMQERNLDLNAENYFKSLVLIKHLK